MYFPDNVDEYAITLFRKAYDIQMQGNYEEAVDLYKKSIEVQPTSEAHTFLGWAYSFMGKIDEAIEECLNAIEVDPTLGNPYNDIGSYLMKQGKYEEAVPWFQKAKLAKRYENREYAYYNLGKVLEYKGLWPLAINEYREALNIQSLYHPAGLALLKLEANLN